VGLWISARWFGGFTTRVIFTWFFNSLFGVYFSKCAACHYKIRFIARFHEPDRKILLLYLERRSGFYFMKRALFYGFALPLWYLLPAGGIIAVF